MSALENLWLWLQGRSSRAEAGSGTMDAASESSHAVETTGDPVAAAHKRELDARVQRHARYRAGPWQMK